MTKRLFAMITAIAVGALALIVYSASPGLAYATNGCRWPTANVPLYNAAPSGYSSLVTAAANDWTNTPTPFQYSFDYNVNTAEVVAAASNFGNTGKDGITYYSVCYSGRYGSGGYQNTSYWNTYYTGGYSTNARIQVMVHELGHALGLAHSGSSTCSGQPIMYYSSNRYFVCGHIGPQQDDINAVNAVY